MTTSLEEKVIKTIRDIPDFPKPGILFKDITPIMLDPNLCKEITDHIAQEVKSQNIDAIAGVESRGFIFGLPLAMALDLPFVMIRKKGKLPFHTVSHSYDLEYGSAEIEMHIDAISEGQKVLIHDDLLATGGTAAATAELIKKQGGIVAGFSFLVELNALEGRKKLNPLNDFVHSLVDF